MRQSDVTLNIVADLYPSSHVFGTEHGNRNTLLETPTRGASCPSRRRAPGWEPDGTARTPREESRSVHEAETDQCSARFPGEPS